MRYWYRWCKYGTDRKSRYARGQTPSINATKWHVLLLMVWIGFSLLAHEAEPILQVNLAASGSLQPSISARFWLGFTPPYLASGIRWPRYQCTLSLACFLHFCGTSPLLGRGNTRWHRGVESHDRTRCRPWYYLNSGAYCFSLLPIYLF